MNVPLLDLKAQYLDHQGRGRAAIAEVMESQHFILGPDGRGVRSRPSPGIADVAHGIGVSSGTRRAAGLPDGRGHRPRRRGHHDAVHVLRHRRRDRARGRDAGVRRHRSGHLQHRPGADRSEGHHAHQGHHAGAPVRPDGRHGRRHGDRDEHGLVVIEDAAQAIGAEYKGRRAGSIGALRLLLVLPVEEPRRAPATAAWSSPTIRARAERLALPARPRLASRSTTTRWSAAISASTPSRPPSSRPSCRTSTAGPPAASAMRRVTTSCSPSPASASRAAVTSLRSGPPRNWCCPDGGEPAHLQPVRDPHPASENRCARR